MKRLPVALLTPTIAACNPFPKDEEETTRVPKAAATPATPKPTPKPGAWMTEKRGSTLRIKDNPLDQKPKK